MSILREIAVKKLTEQILIDCEEEFGRMHHNARLTGRYCFPDFADEDEQERYYHCLSDDFGMILQDLENDIKEQFGFDWKLYQYGRSGATVAPDQFCNRDFRSLDTDQIVNLWEMPDPQDPNWEEGGESWVDAYKYAKAHLEAFKFINEQIRQCSAADLCAWWEDLKAANEWVFGEEEEDNIDDALDEAAG